MNLIRSRGASPTPVAAGWAAAVTAVAAAGGLATKPGSDWYRELEKPRWQPPASLFGPVWTVLYVLVAVAATLATRDLTGRRRRIVVGLFAANLVLNLGWTLVFFRLRSPRAASVEIVALLATIVALIALLWRPQRVAAAALAPYAAWTAFATALTWDIARRN
ncbi:MAG TPA: TspO/MBR family protein [Solirubrobacteraceae bacterium]|nr:TspO/MBR family protein [Solirubrobacteraceae bacterium]